MSEDAWLVRWGEIGLKGGNRHEFEGQLARNLRHVLRPFPGSTVVPLQGRMLVLHPGAPPAVASALRDALCKVCGVTSVSPAQRVAPDLGAIGAVAQAEMERALAARLPGAARPRFRVATRRADKSFPLASMEVERQIGGVLLTRFPELMVDLDHPEIVVGVELRPEGTFVFRERMAGPGGLPVGCLGRALALLSGGIDSPVAAFLAMKRGLLIQCVFFHAAEFTGLGAAEKVKRLARVLSQYEPRLVLHLVPFGAVQVAIKESADSSYRTLLYRRMMHRIAVEVARREHLAALVTGDNLGQVASQTLENLALTAAASALPLLRPLLTNDKEETIALAKRLGTYELSIVDEPDCCTLFQPPRPRIRGNVDDVESNEARLDLPALVAGALTGLESLVFHHGREGVPLQPDTLPSA